ncbi:histidine-rich glycoprotein-like [Musca domestica]|uniref:Histidine-rich glycoprotein-like n=1 Tax=Musca domestica TaxID=7370 RepID=A0A1I8MSX7_MUSDO|nr:histidine-rich glycoprotein-like [Musca domestica]
MRILHILCLLLGLIVISQARRHIGDHHGAKSGHGSLHGLHRHRGSFIRHRRHQFQGPYGYYVNHYDRSHLKNSHHRGLHRAAAAAADKSQPLLMTEGPIEVANKEALPNVTEGEGVEKSGEHKTGRHHYWSRRLGHSRRSMAPNHVEEEEEKLDGSSSNEGEVDQKHRSGHHFHRGGRYHHRYHHHEPDMAKDAADDELAKNKTESNEGSDKEDQVSHRGHHYRRHGGGRHYHRRQHDVSKMENNDETNVHEMANGSYQGFHRRRYGHGHHYRHGHGGKSENPAENPLNEKDVEADSDEEYYGTHRRWRGHHGNWHHRRTHGHSKPEVNESEEKKDDPKDSVATEKLLPETTTSATDNVADNIDVRLGN